MSTIALQGTRAVWEENSDWSYICV